MSIPIDLSLLENALERKYACMSEIDSVYLEHYEHKTVIAIFLAGQTYDDQVMERLLDHELEIRNTLNDLILDFRYIPLLGRESGSAISSAAKEVFKAS